MSKEHTEKPTWKFPLTPEEAIEYLKIERGLVYAVATLRNKRRRGQAKSGNVKKRTTLWEKVELDAIKSTKRTRRVDGDDEASEGGDCGSTVVLKTAGMAA